MFDWAALTLAIIALVFVVLCTVQLAQAFQPRNTPYTLRNAILLALMLCALLSMIFWIKVCIPTFMAAQLVMFFYYIPVWLEFAGLSLLALFYAESVVQKKSRAHLYVCGLVNLIFGLICITITLLKYSRHTTEEQKGRLGLVFVLYACILDLVLAAALGYLGNAFIELQGQSRNISKNLLPRSTHWFRIVNWTVVVCYSLRAFFTLFLGMGIKGFTGTLVYNGHHPVTAASAFVFTIVGQFVPAYCVVFLLWRSASKTSPVLYVQDASESSYRSDSGHCVGLYASGRHGSAEYVQTNPLTAAFGSHGVVDVEGGRTRALSEEDSKVYVVYSNHDDDELGSSGTNEDCLSKPLLLSDHMHQPPPSLKFSKLGAPKAGRHEEAPEPPSQDQSPNCQPMFGGSSSDLFALQDVPADSSVVGGRTPGSKPVSRSGSRGVLQGQDQGQGEVPLRDKAGNPLQPHHLHQQLRHAPSQTEAQSLRHTPSTSGPGTGAGGPGSYQDHLDSTTAVYVVRQPPAPGQSRSQSSLSRSSQEQLAFSTDQYYIGSEKLGASASNYSNTVGPRDLLRR